MIFKKQIPMKKIVSTLLILVSFFGYSQNYKGEISDVKKSGLNQITIDPNIRAAAKDDLRFLRIIDSKKNQIPYAFVTLKKQSESYSPFKIISKQSIQDSITSLIIQNEKKAKISEFNLQIENTSLIKSYSISGSNDAKAWFGLVENQLLTDLVASKGTSLSKNISFPANKYIFLRIVFNDKKSLPVNILSVGIAETQLIPEKLLEVNDFKYQITEDKSKKLTRIVFSAKNNYQIDAISFDIATDYFSRNAKIITKQMQKTKKRTTSYDETLAYFELNSKKDRNIYFNTIDEKEFTIEIENQDNQPLSISKIQVFQKPIVIVSKLNANEKYDVLIDSTYSKPTYDLENFIAETVANFPEVSISNFNKLNAEKAIQAEKTFWETKLFMWICIIIGGGVVAYFAFGLLKDMKNE